MHACQATRMINSSCVGLAQQVTLPYQFQPCGELLSMVLCMVPNIQWPCVVKDVKNIKCGMLQSRHWEDVGVRQSHGAPQCGSGAALCLRPVHRHQLKGVPEELAWALCTPTKGKPKP